MLASIRLQSRNITQQLRVGIEKMWFRSFKKSKESFCLFWVMKQEPNRRWGAPSRASNRLFREEGKLREHPDKSSACRVRSVTILRISQNGGNKLRFYLPQNPRSRLSSTRLAIQHTMICERNEPSTTCRYPVGGRIICSSSTDLPREILFTGV